MANLKNTRTKPPLSLAEHQALGAELRAMYQRLDAIAVDLGARYPERLVAVANRMTNHLSYFAGFLDDQLWKENRGKVPHATLQAVYFPEPKGELLTKTPPVTSFATQPPVTVANKP